MRHLQLSLLLLTAVMATGLPVRAQQDQSTGQSSSAPQQSIQTVQSTPGTVDLIGVGASILNNIINPPTRSAEIQAEAEVKKAKIAAEAEIAKEKLRIEASKNADKVTPVLSQWGVTRVACAPGVAVVNGITTEAVCVQPTNSMPAGYYTYDSAKQQLVRNSGGSPNNSSNNAQNPGGNKPQNSIENSNTQNGQTIRNVQTTRVTSPSSGRRNSSGGGGGF